MDFNNLSSQLIVNPNVAYTKIDDDVVMMGIQDGQLYSINGVGAIIWNLLESSPMSTEALCEYVQTNFNVEPTQCRSDVSKFIDDMITQKMILVCN